MAYVALHDLMEIGSRRSAASGLAALPPVFMVPPTVRPGQRPRPSGFDADADEAIPGSSFGSESGYGDSAVDAWSRTDEDPEIYERVEARDDFGGWGLEGILDPILPPVLVPHKKALAVAAAIAVGVWLWRSR